MKGDEKQISLILILIFFLFLVSFTRICNAKNFPLFEEEWSYKTGAFREIFIDDLNNDGKKELIFLIGNDKILVLNYQGKFLWSYEKDNILSVKISDLYSDNEKEVILTSGRLIANIARCFLWILNNKGETLLKYPNSKVGMTVFLKDIETDDLDDNGYKEIIAGTLRGVYAFKDTYKEKLWYNKDKIPDKIDNLFIDNVLGDKKNEIIAKSFSTI